MLGQGEDIANTPVTLLPFIGAPVKLSKISGLIPKNGNYH
jgi:hypothetical protein